ncbi:MAG TPA: hypothetical protein VKP30_21385 [Polyangiaceae bacterium]|nr:hypothetical protein [Polyangiaceae bacterium]
MDFGQPPSWRPDVEQNRADAYRGTVRDALGGLRNLEQLLGSLRVGPRALSSVLPDVSASCVPLAEAIDGLVAIIIGKLPDAEVIAATLRQHTRDSLNTLRGALATVEQQTLNARNRLRLEEVVSSATRDIEASVELIDLLGEAVWGRTMQLQISEVVREAFRSSDPPGSSQPAVRLILKAGHQAGECVANPRGLVLMLHHLARWAIERVPTLTPVLQVTETAPEHFELVIGQGSGTGEVRYAPSKRLLPMTELALQIAARTMRLGLQLNAESGEVRVEFPSTEPTST